MAKYSDNNSAPIIDVSSFNAEPKFQLPPYSQNVALPYPDGPGYGPGTTFSSDIPSTSFAPPPNSFQHVPQFEAEHTEDPIATAPPLENMDQVTGYENVTFNAAFLLPPSDGYTSTKPPATRASFSRFPTLTEEQARIALLQHVSENCCYGSKAATEMIFRSIENTSAFHYTLETFGEMRETCWKTEPYMGGIIDSPANGPAPYPWDIAIHPSVPYKEAKTQLEIPHTASVKSCHECAAIGRRRCGTCLGDGQVVCTSCGGSGHRHIAHTDHPHSDHDIHHQHHHRHPSHECLFCKGRGRRKCVTCYGEGQVACRTCQGRGQLKCYIQLTVIWQNHVNDYIVERTSLPDELIRNVSGQIAFEEDLARVWPINSFSDDAVNRASADLIQQHITNYNKEKFIQQRHRIRMVPVNQVFYVWKNVDSHFFVYGFENKVYAPDYPQRCCCGCSIL